MPQKKPKRKPAKKPLPEDVEPSPEVLEERGRVVALLAMHEAELGGLYFRLVNLVNSGRDPRDPRDGEDRLQGF